MRKLILFLILIICFNTGYSQNGWIGMDYPQGQYPRDMKFVNANTGWLIGNRILKSTNAGLNWFEQTTPFPGMTHNKMEFLNENTGWIFVYENSSNFRENLKIIRTTNGGENWNLISTTQQSYTVQSIYPLDNNTFFLATGTVIQGPIGPPTFYGGILKTTNGGTTYSRHIYNSDSNYFFSKVSFSNESTGWAIANDSSVYRQFFKSTNGGSTWNPVSLPGTISDFQFINQNSGYVHSFYIGAAILKTTNGGTNWQTIVMHDSINDGVRDIHFINLQTGWVFGRNFSLAKTEDGGVSWKYNRVFPPIYGSTTYAQFIDNFTGWFLGHNGSQYKLYHTVNGGVTNVVQLSSKIPVNFSLSQNYPNPFNPSTIINYQLAINSSVTLKIYDALGNEVQTLVNEKQNAGSYSVDFNAASLPSGIYFYKLVTEKFSETKKMILVK